MSDSETLGHRVGRVLIADAIRDLEVTPSPTTDDEVLAFGQSYAASLSLLTEVVSAEYSHADRTVRVVTKPAPIARMPMTFVVGEKGGDK